VVEENTRQFLAGLPANNILLWGSRGTGKSSLVRALLSAYAPRGLRIVQVDKDDLVHLPAIVDEVKGYPINSSSSPTTSPSRRGVELQDAEERPRRLGVRAAGNVLIYVTSNRRHLVPSTRATTAAR